MVQVSVSTKYDTNSRARADVRIAAGLADVLDEFQRQQIAYCYWKSSRKLPAALAGEGDIDLLVARHRKPR
jgi:hypothetical protein